MLVTFRFKDENKYEDEVWLDLFATNATINDTPETFILLFYPYHEQG